MPPALKPPGAKARLLSALPPRARTRLVALAVADAYARSWRAKHPCAALEALAAYLSDQGRGARAQPPVDAGAVIGYLAAHHAWAAKALGGSGGAAAAAVYAGQLVLGAAEAADEAAADEAASAVATRKAGGGGRGGGGQQAAAAVAAAAAAAAAFPCAEARALLEAARASDGFDALDADARECLALAELAVARMEEAAAGAAE